MKNLFLHFGTYKTGSSAIQKFLSTNRALLEHEGFYYPMEGSYYFPGESSQSLLAYALLGKRPNYVKKDIEFTLKGCVDDIRRDLQKSELENAIVSAEHFFDARTTASMKLVRDVFTPVAQNIKVVIYVRRQDRYLESVYNQLVKGGLMRLPFDEFAAKNHGSNYFEYINRLSDVFGKTNIVIKPFERTQLYREDIVSDFFHLLGISASNIVSDPVNESISAEMCEVIRLIGRNLETYEKHKKLSSLLLSMPFEFDKTKYSICSAELRNAILDRHRASNSAVARDYLGRKDGVLFCESEENSAPVYPGLSAERMAEVAAAMWITQQRKLREVVKSHQSQSNRIAHSGL